MFAKLYKTSELPVFEAKNIDSERPKISCSQPNFIRELRKRRKREKLSIMLECLKFQSNNKRNWI